MPKNPRSKAGKYYPIWAALKQHKSITINAPAHLHKRICKAVINEKYVDLDFKHQEGWRMMYLTYSCNTTANQITFFLNYRPTELLAKDL